MAPRVDRSQPAYIQIVETMKQQIIDGDLADGAPVPSVRELAESWGISRSTAEKALSALRAEGLVHSIPGRGTFVSTQALGHSPGDRHFRASRTGKIYPPDQHARILAAELIVAPDHVAEALGLDPGSLVIRRLRATYRGDTPVSTSTSWHPGTLAERAPKLLELERMKGGTAGYIEQTTGRVATHGRDQVAGQEASVEVAKLLGIAPGAATLAGRNWLYDDAGDALEFGEYHHPAGRWSSYDYTLV